MPYVKTSLHCWYCVSDTPEKICPFLSFSNNTELMETCHVSWGECVFPFIQPKGFKKI